MRKPKYRAWDKENKVMIYPKGILFDGRIVIFNCGTFEPLSGYQITEFTGLFDMHGTPVFEGDILRMELLLYHDDSHREVVGEVFYHEEHLCFMLETKDFPLGYNRLPFFDHGDYEVLDVEVLGNIFENPELLEGEK